MTSFDLKLNQTDIYNRVPNEFFFVDCVYSFFQYFFWRKELAKNWPPKKIAACRDSEPSGSSPFLNQFWF
jgi:hypothetical protein